MEITKGQQLFQTIINKAWEDEAFKTALVANPVQAIENLTGEKVNLPEGKQLVARDQTSEETIYINIPAEQKMDDVELNEERLEAVAGGRGLQSYGNPLVYGEAIAIFAKPMKPDYYQSPPFNPQDSSATGTTS